MTHYKNNRGGTGQISRDPRKKNFQNTPAIVYRAKLVIMLMGGSY